MLIAAIAAAIAAAVAGAGGRKDMFARLFADWRRALRRQVEDPARREAALAMLGEFEAAAANLVEQLAAWTRSFAATNRRYESTQADFDQLADELVEGFTAAQLRIIDLALELREIIGAPTYADIAAQVDAKR